MAHSPRGGIDADTLEIRAIEVTSNSVGDAPMLSELLDQVPDDQEIGMVTAPSRQIALQSPADCVATHAEHV